MRCKSENISVHEAEENIMGFTYVDAGKYLLKTWYLPIFHQELVGNHHQSFKNPSFTKEASIIHVADHLVNNLELGDSGEISFPSPMNQEAWKNLELTDKISLERLNQEIQKKFNATIQVFLQAA
jgi:HD-like signal output (HDOD) protein